MAMYLERHDSVTTEIEPFQYGVQIMEAQPMSVTESGESGTDSSDTDSSDLLEWGRVVIMKCLQPDTDSLKKPWRYLIRPVINEIDRLSELGYKPSEIEILISHKVSKRTIRWLVNEKVRSVQVIAPQIGEGGPPEAMTAEQSEEIEYHLRNGWSELEIAKEGGVT